MKAGDWVGSKRSLEKIGYVEEVVNNLNHRMIRVRLVGGMGDRMIRSYASRELFLVGNQPTDKDIHNLQLLAVDLGDKSWFEELGEQRKLIK